MPFTEERLYAVSFPPVRYEAKETRMALIPFTSHLIADTGISMGDEGKGRLIPEIIDELRHRTGEERPVSMVLKVNGGSNSGHTVGGLKLNLIPGGIADSSRPSLGIGAGVVADPLKFQWELAYLNKEGLADARERLLIDERALVSDLSHRLLDLAWEHYRSHILHNEPRGSTGRGITPAYADEVGQFQIHYAEFRGLKDDFAIKLRARADRAVRTIEHVCQVPAEEWPRLFETLTQAEKRANKATVEAGFLESDALDFHRFADAGGEPFRLNLDELVECYWSAGQELKKQIGDVREAVLEALAGDRYVIGEFGQSFWLDKRAGFPPNVTASHTFVPEFFQSASIPAQPVHNIGCCKAYDTKVGTHIFLTQMDDGHPLARKLKELEFGTSTGRQRMVGWFDAVEKGDALRYGGFQDMMLNKLDALSASGDWTGDELLLCTCYCGPDGAEVRHVPRNDHYRKQCTPVFERLPGWKEDISGVRSWNDLPAPARYYVARAFRSVLDVAGQLDAKEPANLRYIGVGPDPSQIIKDVPPTAELLELAGQGVR